MTKPILGVALLLAFACSVRAQDNANSTSSDRGAGNAAAAFSDTSAAQVTLFDANNTNASNFTTSAATSSEATPVPASPSPTPSPKPKFVWGDRDDYRWQLAVGVEFYRFESNVLTASMVGTNTTVSYYTNTWFAVEGNIVTGFAPPVVGDEHVKYFGGGGGIRIGGRRNQFEPWAHALVGGAHLQPQTAAGNRSALAAQAGVGLDYRINSRLSARAEIDWVYTTFFNQTQNNFQATTGLVFHF